MSYKLFVYNCTSHVGDLASKDTTGEFHSGFDGIFNFSSAPKNPKGYISFLKNFVNAKNIMSVFHFLKSK